METINWFICPLITLFVFIAMEGITWLTHKFVMHGLGWYFHEDHHRPGYENVFEKNDYFFLIFAVPSWLCIMLGFIYQVNFSIGFGFGIALYGLVYFLVHDVLIHRRFKWFDKTNNAYFRAIRKAHKIHHKRQGKEDGECFGMLVVPKKYFNS